MVLRYLGAAALIFGSAAALRWSGATRQAQGARLETIPAFHSGFLNNSRTITVYLPPGYSTGERRYPVLYLVAGPDDFSGGMRYNAEATAQILAGTVEPLILVGIDNPSRSFDELFPSPGRGTAGRGPLYLRMIVDELKPRIDVTYRTLPDPANTGIGGVSAGGQISFYAAITRPNVFGKMFAISAPLAANNSEEVRRVRYLPAKLPVRIYFDRGSEEGNGERNQHDADQAMRNALLSKGWSEGTDFVFVQVPGGIHKTASFAPRVGPILRFLFPAPK
jgi:predicted alpha/beta superfamily hydrolase